MKTIYKYILEEVINSFAIPKGAKILTVASQHNKVCIWVECDEKEDTERRDFHIFGTGLSIPEGKEIILLKYVGTAIIMGGNSVLHVYENIYI